MHCMQVRDVAALLGRMQLHWTYWLGVEHYGNESVGFGLVGEAGGRVWFDPVLRELQAALAGPHSHG